MAFGVYVFDAYGTLFDVHAAVRRHAEAIGPQWPAFSDVWRAKQLEYSWVRALMERYRDFWTLTQEALDHAFARFPDVDRGLRARLLEAYERLDHYPEVPAVLTALRAAGARTAILSNGSPGMLASAVASAGIGEAIDEVLSVDALATYKTRETVYELVTTRFRVFPEDVSFQSSNRWDVAGASAFGFRTVWINRGGAPDEYADLPPAAVLPTLEGLPDL